ncbi:MAG: aminoglycoside phosphotransferase family protein [Chitinophagaceae bacterium]
MTKRILAEFGLDPDQYHIKVYGSGLINHTWRITNLHNDYILQRINNKVFVQPLDIAFNIHTIAEYFKKHHPDYLFTVPIQTVNHQEMVYDKEEGYFRLFPFIRNSHTIDVVMNTQQAYEASRQFGLFTRLLAGLPAESLKITAPGFHNLSLRYEQFEAALKKGNKERITQSKDAIGFIQEHKDILEQFEKIKKNPHFKLRVTHHDTKISNVLFDAADKGICVIDLDTLMPGFFISDVGDMIRTYLSPASEEEKDFDKIEVREEFFRAILEGYLGEMRNELSNDEIGHFIYAGKFMIYMQAIRFLADHINNDSYYGATYPDHNLVRARNQVILLQKLTEREKQFDEIVKAYKHEVSV